MQRTSVRKTQTATSPSTLVSMSKHPELPHQTQSEENQIQTRDTFAYKWSLEKSYGSEVMDYEWRNWLREKYFDSDPVRIDELFAGDGRPKKLLDAGCGAGKSALLLFEDKIAEHSYYGVDISSSVEVATVEFQKRGLPGTFHQCALDNIPEDFGNFDLIFSEGVLHHTHSVEDSIRSLSSRLVSGGHMLFYVYSKKAPVREFTDDLLREELRSMSDEEAWEALISLSKFGKALGDLDAQLTLDEEVPLLGIKKGTHSLQRLFYYCFLKAFYHPGYRLEELNHINFDWFRPANCHRHTPDEVKNFTKAAGLVVERLNVGPSGITVIARKRGRRTRR